MKKKYQKMRQKQNRNYHLPNESYCKLWDQVKIKMAIWWRSRRRQKKPNRVLKLQTGISSRLEKKFVFRDFAFIFRVTGDGMEVGALVKWIHLLRTLLDPSQLPFQPQTSRNKLETRIDTHCINDTHIENICHLYLSSCNDEVSTYLLMKHRLDEKRAKNTEKWIMKMR